VALAGGGVRGGQVIGATNGFGEVPVDRPVSPEDLAWSLLTRMGINPATELTTPTGRPVRLLNQGTFIRELLG
jgi:hypothetical protein